MLRVLRSQLYLFSDVVFIPCDIYPPEGVGKIFEGDIHQATTANATWLSVWPLHISICLRLGEQ